MNTGTTPVNHKAWDYQIRAIREVIINGSKICERMGCTTLWADNYDNYATTNDGSCDRLGCIYDWADNYDILSTSDDGSCDRLGCVYDWADNYDSYATTDDESCVRVGCTNEFADNYDNFATSGFAIGDIYQGGYIFQIYHGGFYDANGWQMISQTTALIVDTINLESGNWYDAPGIASNSTSGGYNDWFLPDTSQLVAIYNSIGLGSELGNISGIEGSYWSTQSASGNHGFRVDMNTRNYSSQP